MPGEKPQFSKTDLRRGLLTGKARAPEPAQPAQPAREDATGKLEQALLFGEDETPFSDREMDRRTKR